MFGKIKAVGFILLICLSLVFGLQSLVDEFLIQDLNFDLAQSQLTGANFDKPLSPSIVSLSSNAATLSANPDLLLEKSQVLKVVDGDTIKLIDGRTVRYIGIDTPETVHPNKPVECYGLEASQANKNLVEGKEVWLEKDISEVDRFQRLLRYVYVSDATATPAASKIMVNAMLIESGYAFASSYPPDVKYQAEFSRLEEGARVKQVGLWSVTGCGVQ